MKWQSPLSSDCTQSVNWLESSRVLKVWLRSSLPRSHVGKKVSERLCVAAKRTVLADASLTQAGLVAALVEASQHVFRDRPEPFARRREADRLRRAVEQRRTDPFLEALDPPAERGLGRVPRFGRAGEIARIDKTEKVFEPADFHGGRVSPCACKRSADVRRTCLSSEAAAVDGRHCAVHWRPGHSHVLAARALREVKDAAPS